MGRQTADTREEDGTCHSSDVSACLPGWGGLRGSLFADLPENVSFGATQAEESMEEEFSGIGKAIAS